MYAGILFLTLPLSMAHSWVEQLRCLHSNGTMFGNAGFMRNAISRLDPAFNDLRQQYLLPPPGRDANLGILPDDLICKDTQQAGNYNDGRPQLKARPGEFIALQYQENGHVTLPEATPQKVNNGTVSVYGTSFPSDNDRLLSIHHVWNTEGTGGDRRGILLATGPFDDFRCYQINDGPISLDRQERYRKAPMDPQGADLWCQQDFRLPLDVRDNYTVYWVWEWPSAPTAVFPQGQVEIYTSCMDIQVLPGIQDEAVSYVQGQDLNLAGVEEQMLAGQAM